MFLEHGSSIIYIYISHNKSKLGKHLKKVGSCFFVCNSQPSKNSKVMHPVLLDLRRRSLTLRATFGQDSAETPGVGGVPIGTVVGNPYHWPIHLGFLGPREMLFGNAFESQ